MNWYMKSQWVIAYDLDVKGMQLAGYTQSNVTQYYNGMKKILADHGFSKFSQLSLYMCEPVEGVISLAIDVVDDLRAMPDNHFINRLHVFKVEEFSDLRPKVVKESSSNKDPIEEKIEEVFEGKKAA